MKRDRIILVGFMGSGKTSVAAALARLLDTSFVDLDSFIQAQESRSPAELIQQDGEPSFRQIEISALRAVLASQAAEVVALGGGAWAIEENRALLNRNNCLTVWLDAPFELCWSRIKSAETTRPLAPDRAAAQALFQSRRQSYELASVKVDVCEADSPESLARRILEIT